MARIDGDDGDNTLTGTGAADDIAGEGGDDRLQGRGGDDTLHGSGGHDLLEGGAGRDYLVSQTDDRILGGTGDDILAISRGAGGGLVDGGSGEDTVYLLFHSSSRPVDSAIIPNLTGRAVSFEGVTFSGMERAVVAIDGVAALDRSAVHVELTGGSGDDHLTGNQRADTLNGRGGDDTLDGGGGDDFLEGGGRYYDERKDRDLLRGGAGNDTLSVGYGGTTLQGGEGADTLTGGRRMEGGGGDDTLISTGPENQMIGGDGADTYVFVHTSDSTSKHPDTIIDSTIAAVDLSGIDAKGDGGSDDAFTVVDAFDGQSGELVLIYLQEDRVTQVQGDTNGDGEADLLILIKGHYTDPAGFVL